MRQLFSLFIVFFCIVCQAQDKIHFHNGTIAEGKVCEVTEDYVKFIYKDEEANHTIGSASISKIEFASGRIQQGTTKITIESPEDWEKVVVVYDKNKVMGLKSLGKIEKHSNGAWSFHNTTGHFMKKAITKAQKQAAKMGGCYILVVNQSNNAGGGFGNYADSSIICEVFTY